MRAWITDEPIDTAAVLAAAGRPANGAVLLFTGVVREENDGRAVTGMRYDAYAAMAERVLGEIVAEAGSRASTEDVFAVHRIGDLAVGEASIAIAVGTAHRVEAFEAARYVIEEVKKRLPVWKLEKYREHDARWLDGAVPELPNV